ncbi:MAG: BatA domain-containing protein [Flavobacteriales bacterium]|nr:BatA domain-containing protein [Flavobacteriales bacterium]
MQFVHPGFLWALTALAIPVLIHLFQLRRFKRIDFPDVRHLKAVAVETKQQRRIQHWLILLARLVAVSCLVLAFAQPYLPQAGAGIVAGRKAVSIYIDDSYSMDGQNAGGRLLDQARKGAQDALMAHSPADRFQIITNRFEGRDQLLLDRDAALDRAVQVNSGPYGRPLPQVMARQRDALRAHEAPVKRAILFSDLQRSMVQLDDWKDDSLVRTVIVPMTPLSVDNLSVDSVWFDSPVRRIGRNEALHVRIRNHGEQALENIPFRLMVDGRQRAMGTFAVEPRQAVDTVLHFTNDQPGDHCGVVSLSDKPVSFDDALTIAYRTIDQPRVLLLEGTDPASDRRVEAVFHSDSAYRFSRVPLRQADLSSLGRADLIVLNAPQDVATGLARSLADAVEEGASLAVFPALNSPPSTLAPLLAEFGMAAPAAFDTSRLGVERMEVEHPFFRDAFTVLPRNLDLPFTLRHLPLRTPPGADILLRTRDGSPFLAAVQKGKGTVYLCATPLAEDAGNLTRHALFVTSLLRMAELSRPSGPLYHQLGADAIIPLFTDLLLGDQVVHLRGPDGVDVVPEVRRTPAGTGIVVHGTDLPEGAYAVVLGPDTLRLLALVRPRQESDLAVYTPGDLQRELEQRGLTTFEVLDRPVDQVGAGLKALDGGRRLWKWFIWAALAALAMEIVLIRWRP